jgi:AbiV family abortive infection protein
MLNSTTLFGDARALYERGSFGIARSLAISAREECGKVLIACAYLGGMVAPEEFVVQLRDHKPKQAEGLILGALLNGVLEHPGRFRGLIEIDAPTLLEFAEQFGLSVQERNDEWSAAVAPLLPSMHADRDAATAGAHEAERQAGVYVTMDVEEGAVRISHPFQITKAECEEELARLGALLDAQVPAELNWKVHEFPEATLTVGQLASYIDQVFSPAMVNRFGFGIDGTSIGDASDDADSQ